MVPYLTMGRSGEKREARCSRTSVRDEGSESCESMTWSQRERREATNQRGMRERNEKGRLHSGDTLKLLPALSLSFEWSLITSGVAARHENVVVCRLLSMQMRL